MNAVERDVLNRLERASVYRVLGWALGRPEQVNLAEIADAAASLAPTLGRGVGEPLAAFAAAARETDAQALAGEYVFLFDRGAKCPPYEGAWGDAPQLAGKGALLADVAGFYAAFGLAPGDGQPDTEDHIAAECEFMSALSLKEAYAVSEGNADGVAVTSAAQSSFVADHLGRWAGTFSDTLREASPLPYYRALADVLGAWAQAEADRLGARPATICGRAGHDPMQDADAPICPMANPEAGPAGPEPGVRGRA